MSLKWNWNFTHKTRQQTNLILHPYDLQINEDMPSWAVEKYEISETQRRRKECAFVLYAAVWKHLK